MVSDELLKTLAEDGCQSNGPPVVQACDFIFLRYGHNGGFFEASNMQKAAYWRISPSQSKMLGLVGLIVHVYNMLLYNIM